MAALFVLRHAERSGIMSLHDVVHARITDGGRRDARSLGKMLSRFLNESETEVMSSQLNRCAETAKEFASGYGVGARYIGEEPSGNLTYMFPGMAGHINSERFSEESLVARYGRMIAILPKMFEEDYPGTVKRWLDGGFAGTLVSPLDIHNEILNAARKSGAKAFMLFVSDVQISVMGALNGMQGLVDERPGFLHGAWTEDAWSRNWRVFHPDRIE